MYGINARNWEHICTYSYIFAPDSGLLPICIPPQMGKLSFFPDPMAVVFWSKNRVLYIGPQKGKQDVLIPNMVLILAYGLCIKSYEHLE